MWPTSAVYKNDVFLYSVYIIIVIIIVALSTIKCRKTAVFIVHQGLKLRIIKRKSLNL